MQPSLRRWEWMPMPGELGRKHHDICLRYRGEVTIGLDGRHTNPAPAPRKLHSQAQERNVSALSRCCSLAC